MHYVGRFARTRWRTWIFSKRHLRLWHTFVDWLWFWTPLICVTRFQPQLYSNINEDSRSWIHLSSYDVLQQITSRKKATIVFAAFKYLARWLGIINSRDLHSTEGQTTSKYHHNRIQVRGTMQFSGCEQSHYLNVFYPRSFFKVNVTDSGDHLGCYSFPCLWISNIVWDAVNMRFVRQWYLSDVVGGI